MPEHSSCSAISFLPLFFQDASRRFDSLSAESHQLGAGRADFTTRVQEGASCFNLGEKYTPANLY